jgi:hypothetical protein
MTSEPEERMTKRVEKLEDGRTIIYYTFERAGEAEKESK